MQVFRFHRNQLDRFDDQHLNLVYNQQPYSRFLNRTFSFDNVEDQIEEKEVNYSNRKELVSALMMQYTDTEDSTDVLANIQSLGDENTFTVTTGHQLSLMTGPLYFVVKILHVIKLSARLNDRFPGKKFVPVYWMASEDHDFEEIKNFQIFGKTISWEANHAGPVGRFPMDGFDHMKDEVRSFFQNNPESDVHSLLDAYSGHTLAEATKGLVHELFKDYGLVIVDGDDAELKKLFVPAMEKELKERFSYDAVSKTSKVLKKEGGKIQVNPREVNLFYIESGVRSRIVHREDGYFIGGIGEFSEAELLEMLSNHPERFSPNVILRPLYQETILPNIAYVGGVGEISYWLQLKGVFDAVGCTYPMIDVRNSVMWIDSATSRKMAKVSLHIEETFRELDAIKKSYVEEHSSDELDFSEMNQKVEELSKLLEEMILTVDMNKKSYVIAETTRLRKQIDGVQAKMVKHSKSKHEEAIRIIETVQNKLFPNGGLQERSANFFSFCPDGDYKSRIRSLYSALDPEENDFIILRES